MGWKTESNMAFGSRPSPEAGKAFCRTRGKRWRGASQFSLPAALLEENF